MDPITECIYDEGLQIEGHGVSKSYSVNRRRFEAIFGIPGGLVALMWSLISACLPKNATYTHLLMGLYFLKKYDSESDSAGRFGVDEKTYRKWIWFIVKEIGKLHPKIVS